jgi:CspA family cold shock protein
MYGTVVLFKPEKGFGFIRHSCGDDDTFFHVTDFPTEEPRVGQGVEFRIGQRKGRALALDIKLLPAGAVAGGGGVE